MPESFGNPPTSKTTTSTLAEEQITEIKKQGITATARAVIWGVGALLIMAVTGWGFYLRDYFNRQFPQLPADALVMFKDRCPDSTWEALTDKDGGASGAYLRIASPDISSRGGENEHTLTKNDIPMLQSSSTQDVGAANPGLWGGSGPQGQLKVYSFGSRDGGLGGTAFFEFKTLFVGTSSQNQTAIEIQPKYLSVVLCAKKP
jgi:hypothetical protein